ncbi:MAG: Hsp70 family protein [Sedimentisphaerales bacterium]|jgi:molecular chaperone DnaK
MNTINYGIDLGTTKSAIAVLDELKPEVVPNREGASFTPSAAWVDKKGTIRIGRLAKERYEVDSENCAIEFKRAMGMGKQAMKTFKDSGKQLLPEELSAEVLKSLKADVFQNRNHNLQAVVITVPAAFELPQCEATRKAAELAGFSYSPLLQEPVAASLAYGFQSASDKEFWLVYDFGGGTFDAAIIQVRDGVIQVVNHAGDNFLGGGLLDWQIVEKVFVPSLRERYDLGNFERGNKKWRPAFGKLKINAEKAKIEVARNNTPYKVWIDCVCTDDSGKEAELDCSLTPEILASVSAPYVNQSVNLCKKVLKESGFKPEHISKVIMVGGTTLLPSLRKSLKEQLGIPLEFSIDPITVVARGAAIFAGTQKLDIGGEALAKGVFRLDFKNYNPIGNDIDPQVGGQVINTDCRNFNGYSIEIIETKSAWQSGRIQLAANGAFITEVHAEKGRKCKFHVNLYDTQGIKQQIFPDTFSYTIGLTITSAPLTHSVGVSLANNKPKWIFNKGDSLPTTKKKSMHVSALCVRKNNPDDKIIIPLIEGCESVADNNSLVGEIVIESSKISHDIPPGAEVEVYIKIDESRMIEAEAYIPVLNQTFTSTDGKIIKLGELQVREQQVLQKELVEINQQILDLENRASEADVAKAKNILGKIKEENLIANTLDIIKASNDEKVEAQHAEGELRKLRSQRNAVEVELKLPELTDQAEKQRDIMHKIISQYGNDDEKTAIVSITKELNDAIDTKDKDSELIESLIETMHALTFTVLDRQIWFWVDRFQYLEEHKALMSDQNLADQLFDQGRRAITNEDFEAIKTVVRQLHGLLSQEEQKREESRAYGSGII